MELEFYYEQGCYREDEVKNGEISDGYGGNINENQSRWNEELISLCEESVEGDDDLNSELMHDVIGGGDSGYENAIGLVNERYDGLEGGFKSPIRKE
ncbi:hypothetical protein SLA2020_123860 [Shorea laevis]